MRGDSLPPPLEGEGRLASCQRVGAKRRPMINSARCETGGGDGLSTWTLFAGRDCHPTPLATRATLPLQGRVEEVTPPLPPSCDRPDAPRSCSRADATPVPATRHRSPAPVSASALSP